MSALDGVPRRVPILLLSCLLSSSFCTSQTKWFKYVGNPVLKLGPDGSWDSRMVWIDRVIIKEASFRMWYSGDGGLHYAIGHATSADGVNWKKDRSNPVLTHGSQGSWEATGPRNAFVLYSDSEYKMWYNGHALEVHSVGYASSRDGIVWKKYANNPVLALDRGLAWERTRIGMVSVAGPDTAGAYRMWYQGVPGWDIGYATSKDETSWQRHSDNPIVAGSDIVYHPTVLSNGRAYEMWYSEKEHPDSRIRYATSEDGTEWTKPSEIVMTPGPNGWEKNGIIPGDVHFDGDTYHMWYQGLDQHWQGGYAVSPKRLSITVQPAYVSPASGLVHVVVQANQRAGRRFSALIRAGSTTVADLDLHDDGEHGDGLPRDGAFATVWLPQGEATYTVDLNLYEQRQSTIAFAMENAGRFTTLGPITCERFELSGNRAPNPGDSVYIRFVLRNRGTRATIGSVSSLLSSPDTLVLCDPAGYQEYGDIPASEPRQSMGYHAVYIRPEFPAGREVKLNVSIFSERSPFWDATASFTVAPPWWRSDWVLGLFGLSGLAIVYAGVVILANLRKYELRQASVRHQQELERIEAEKLRELDHLKSRFFANISHEFRTPLTLILGPIERWKDVTRDEQLLKDLGMMERNSHRLLRLINQLLDISKVEAGSMKLHASPGNIVTFVKSIAESFHSAASDRKIGLRCDCDGECIELFFDRDKMEKILGNLLSNAIKFTPEGGEVRVEVRRNRTNGREYAEIHVADTGIGIPETDLPHIFDRFYRVEHTHTRAHEGTGIGLALVKELVDAHHGRVGVESTVGKGTTFSVQFPLGDRHLTEEEKSQALQDDSSVTIDLEAAIVAEERSSEVEERDFSPSNGKPTVLIVEDSPDVMTYVREHLGAEYGVLEAGDGTAGLRTALTNVPDLIISDVMMPGLDGYELCTALKKDETTSHIPIILLTAKAGPESRIEGLETGADDYVTKPFDARELRTRVQNLIDQRRALRERFSKEVTLKPSEVAIVSADERFLNRAMQAVEAHISDESFTAEVFAKEMFLSRMQLHRKLKALTNRSPWEFVRAIRLARAAQLLRDGAGNVSEIAYQVGYSDHSHFADAFRRQFGVRPSEYMVTRAKSG